MFRRTRRPAGETDIRFCDSCAEVTTGAERAERRVDRTRAEIHALIGPR